MRKRAGIGMKAGWCAETMTSRYRLTHEECGRKTLHQPKSHENYLLRASQALNEKLVFEPREINERKKQAQYQSGHD